MKKVLLLSFIIVVISCTKQDLSQYQDVTFGCALVEEYSMTKTINHSTIKSIITSTIPEDVNPVFYYNNDELQGVNVKVGTETSMKVGTWGVKWKNIPNQITNIINDKTYFAKVPLLDINTEVAITPGTTEYTLPVSIKSFAIVVDATEISRVQYYTLGQSYQDIDFFIESGDNKIIFINGEFTSNSVIRFKLFPADNSRKETAFYLSNDLSTFDGHDTVHIEYGKYYVLHPDLITEVGSLFNLNIPEWTCGNEEI